MIKHALVPFTLALLFSLADLSNANALADNIAKPELSIILSSSKERSANVIENAIDGNLATKWISAENVFPNWIEIQWPQPVFIDRLVVNEDPCGPSGKYRIDSCDKGTWQTIIGPKANQTPPNSCVDESFTPHRATKIRYYMLEPRTAGQAYASVDEMQVFGRGDWIAGQTAVGPPDWRSWWIWYPEPDVSVATRYFRRAFELDDTNALENASLQIAADDGYQVYINGRSVGSGGKPAQLYDITPLLLVGKNIIAIRGQENTGFEGVIADITFRRKDGGVTHLLTDNQWLACKEVTDGWTLLTFDDSKWLPAKQTPYAPNELNYRDMASKELFECLEMTASPQNPRPGDDLVLYLSLRVSKPIRNDYGFNLKLAEPKMGIMSDYTVADVTVLPDTNTSQWLPGKSYSVKISLTLPQWSPHGKIPVWLTPFGKGVWGVVGKDQGRIGEINIRRFPQDPKPWPTVAPTAQVRQYKGKPALFINGKVTPPYIMCENEFQSFKASGEHINAGTKIWRVIGKKGISSPFIDNDFAAENKALCQAYDQNIRCLLRIDPNAYVIVGMNTSGIPQNWLETNPDDTAVLSDGRKLKYSLSSPKWRARVLEETRMLVAHLTTQDYAGHIIGILFTMNDETYYPGVFNNNFETTRDTIVLGDYNKYHTAAFRQWLKTQYGNDLLLLQNTWNDRSVTFDTAAPDFEMLRRQDLMVFRDPARSKAAIDYWQFHAEVTAERIIEIARTIKETSSNRFITGFYGMYSNGFMAADPIPGRLQQAAFSAIQKVLSSPYIDYFGVLQEYADVRWTTPMVPMNLTESIKKHGKMPLMEFDVRTFFVPLIHDHQTYSQPETLSVLERDAFASAVRGYPLWWMGFPSGTHGRISIPWFAEDSMLKTLEHAGSVYKTVYENLDVSSVSEVAVFCSNRDVWSIDTVEGYKLLSCLQYKAICFELNKLGLPFDAFELQDIALPGMDKYKVYVFLNAFDVPPDLRKAITKLIDRKGKTVVWLYAPGFSDGKTLSTANIRQLTGFSVGYDQQTLVPAINVIAGTKYTKALPHGYSYQTRPYLDFARNFKIGPVFYIDDPDAQVLGTYAHNNKAACAYKKIGPADSIYLAIPYLDTALMREICRGAGVHQFYDGDLYLDASRNVMTITNTNSDRFTGNIALPRKAAVYDVVNNASLAADEHNSIKVEVPPLSTRIYFYGSPGEIKAAVRSLQVK